MKHVLNSFLLLLLPSISFAQDGVGIGITAPDPSSVLHVESPDSTKGMLIPRMTEADRDNIINNVTPAEGLIIYNSTAEAFDYYDGDGWVRLIPTPVKFNIDMASEGINYKIINLANGTEERDAINKGQLDSEITLVDNANLNRNGSEAMTGNLNMNNLEIQNLNAGDEPGEAINFDQLSDLRERVLNIERKFRYIPFTLKEGNDPINEVAEASFEVTELVGNYQLSTQLRVRGDERSIIRYILFWNGVPLVFNRRTHHVDTDDNIEADLTHIITMPLLRGSYRLVYTIQDINNTFISGGGLSLIRLFP